MAETQLAVLEGEKIDAPIVIMTRASEVASACKQVVLDLALSLNKKQPEKKYLPVEAWQTIAALYHCAAGVREVVLEPDGSVRAIAEVRNASGVVIATGEGYCGMDEPLWASRAAYARRGMASTRAQSRALRGVFAFVVTLIAKETGVALQTTPAEEIPQDDTTQRPAPRIVSGTVMAEPVRSKETTVRFGKSKGKYLCDIEDSDLEWQLAAAIKSVDAQDPKWHAANVAWAKTVQAEAERRTGK